MTAASPRYEFGKSLMLLGRRWRATLDHALATAGLTDASWAPLVRLAEDGDGVSQIVLASRLGLDASSLVRLIDILESGGLAERQVDPEDRRARRIVLTAKGRAEYARIRQLLDEIEQPLLGDIEDNRIEMLMAGFAQIEQRIAARLERTAAD